MPVRAFRGSGQNSAGGCESKLHYSGNSENTSSHFLEEMLFESGCHWVQQFRNRCSPASNRPRRRPPTADYSQVSCTDFIVGFDDLRGKAPVSVTAPSVGALHTAVPFVELLALLIVTSVGSGFDHAP